MGAAGCNLKENAVGFTGWSIDSALIMHDERPEIFNSFIILN